MSIRSLFRLLKDVLLFVPLGRRWNPYWLVISCSSWVSSVIGSDCSLLSHHFSLSSTSSIPMHISFLNVILSLIRAILRFPSNHNSLSFPRAPLSFLIPSDIHLSCIGLSSCKETSLFICPPLPRSFFLSSYSLSPRHSRLFAFLLS